MATKRKPTHLTEEHLSMIRYFWQEKENIQRYAEYNNIVELLEKHKPELMKAWRDYQAARKILNTVIDNLTL